MPFSLRSMVPARRPPSTPSSPLPPYLTSRPLLLLSLLSPPILALLLALSTLLLLASQSTSAVASAKREILAGCQAAEKAAGVLEQVPALMKEQGEKALKKAVEGGVEGVGDVLILLITVLEAVLKFAIDTFRSIYLCCLELAVFGSLAVVIGAVEEISDAITTTLSSIRTLIQSEVSTANSVVQSAVDGINDITSVFGISAFSISNLSIPALSALENVTVGTTFEAELRKLNDSLPTLDDVRSTLDDLIDQPFDAMILKINSTTSNFTFSPSSASSNATSTSLLTTSSTGNDSLCAGLDLSFVDEIGDELAKIKAWGIGLLVVVILIAIAVLMYLETLRYRSMLDRVQLYRASLSSRSPTAEDDNNDDRTHTLGETELMELVELGQMSVCGVWMWSVVGGWKRLGEGGTRRGKWLVSLIFHPLALAPLLIGSIGLLAIWFQLAAVSALEDRAASLTASSVDDMSSSLTSALNTRLANAGQEWAADVNRQVGEAQTMLDDELFGEWVNTTTVVLNTTLVDFYSLVTDAVNATFGSTILEAPISTFLYCMVGSKIVALEQALTWIHDNAHFTLPTVDDDIFSVSNQTTEELVTPIANAAVGSTDDDDDEGVLQRLIEHYKAGLRNAQIIHAVFVGLWGVVVLAGIVTVVLDARREQRARDGKPPTSDRLGAVVGSWPVFKVLGRGRRVRWSNVEQPRSYSSDDDGRPEVVEKVRSLEDAFSITGGRPLPSTPLSPSHHHLTAPATASYAPPDRTHSYFEFDGGADQSSPYPWPLRSTALRSSPGREPGRAPSGWTSKLKDRMAALAAGLQPGVNTSAVALQDDADESSARRFTSQAPINNPFTDDAHLPIAQAHSNYVYHPSSTLPAPPARYAVNPSPYHAIGSPSDRFLPASATPIFAQHQRAGLNPFADDTPRTAGAQGNIGKDPWQSPFDDPRA